MSGWLKPLHVLPVYAIQVYRHRFIIHLEKPRVHVYAHHPDGSLWGPDMIGRFPV